MLSLKITSDLEEVPSRAICVFTETKEEVGKPVIMKHWSLMGNFDSYTVDRKGEAVGCVELPIQGKLRDVLEGDLIATYFTKYEPITEKHMATLWILLQEEKGFIYVNNYQE